MLESSKLCTGIHGCGTVYTRSLIWSCDTPRLDDMIYSAMAPSRISAIDINGHFASAIGQSTLCPRSEARTDGPDESRHNTPLWGMHTAVLIIEETEARRCTRGQGPTRTFRAG
jgi:hypothetical protein